MSNEGPLTALVAVSDHVGRAAHLVRELKYRRVTTVVTELAEAMAESAPEADVVTWVPASPSRRRQRGFDQGELLARAVARRLRVPVRPLLRREDDVAQTARDRAGRLAGPALSRRGRRLRFKPTVLLVDDVYTTGGTLRAAATVLRSHGAGDVVGLVVTRVVPNGHFHGAAIGLQSSYCNQPEVSNGRLHQCAACDHHAETGGGDPRKDRSTRPLS